MAKVLIIEDEPAIADTLLYTLQSEQFETHWVGTGGEGIAAARDHHPDCIVLDVGLPDMLGFDVCRRIRVFSSAPVIFLTARDGEIDRVLGLELGADDYVVKPFSPRELAARVRAILRRTNSLPANPPDASDAPAASTGAAGLVHDTLRKRIVYNNHPLPLTRNEYLLLATLLASPGRVFSRDQLMDAAWEDPGAALDRTVDAHVKSVRAKLRAAAPDCQFITTHRGLGYAFAESPWA